MMGLGFAQRSESSEFAAALDDYRTYLKRKVEALKMRQQVGAPDLVYYDCLCMGQKHPQTCLPMSQQVIIKVKSDK